jgi:plasmid stabilization system protein ParE
VAADSERYAAVLVTEVREAARSLNEFAERGRVVPEFGNPQFRELLVRNHRLIYRVQEDVVTIYGFIHGARDLLALWRRERRDLPENGA